MGTKSIPLNRTSSVTLEYRGDSYTVSSPRYNKYMHIWMIDISWEEGSVLGIPLYSGINLLANFSTPLPELWAFSTKNFAMDADELTTLQLWYREDE